MYLSRSNQKTETTKGLSNRRSLIEGTDHPDDGGLRSPQEMGKQPRDWQEQEAANLLGLEGQQEKVVWQSRKLGHLVGARALA